MSKYHVLLGVRSGASKEEIKKAYRKKAFEFHPDKNKSADAQERFIEITVAYEALTSGGHVPLMSMSGSQKKKPASQQAPTAPEAFKAWYASAKQKAEEQAKYRYQDFRKQNAAFKKTTYYPFAKLFTLLVILISSCFTLGLFSIPFWVGIYGKDWFMTIISVLYTVPGIWAFKYTMELKKGYDIHFGN